MNRKLCKRSSGRRARARGWLHSAGQRYCAAMIPQARKLRATQVPKRACGDTRDSLPEARSCCRTIIRQNPVRLGRLSFLPNTGHNVRHTEPARDAICDYEEFKLSNRLRRRQQTTGEVRLMADSLSSAPTD